MIVDEKTPYDIVMDNKCPDYYDCKMEQKPIRDREIKKHHCTKEAGKTCPFRLEVKKHGSNR